MLKLSGYSDDNVEISGDYRDEIGCYDSPVDFVIGSPEAKPGENAHGLRVRMEYAPKWCDAGVWTAAISPIEEDCPIPWLVSISAEGYSIIVEICCPKGTPVVARIGKKIVWQNGKATRSDE